MQNEIVKLLKKEGKLSEKTINELSNIEIARYDLSEDASTETAMIFGELYRHGAEWKFRAVGQGYVGGLAAMATQYGISVG